ncbi:MAG TPA: hypothetical protein VFO31_24065 [Vicinamibacterales bacterium]|nr:hypothetical protein [Vicinamibacterales bacterium]
MTTTTTRRLTSALAALLTAGALTTAGSAGSPKFLNDDPVWHEPDTQDASGIKADEVNLFVDLTYNLIAGAGQARGRAGNLNSIDEVPDSSWFTNRAGVRELTTADVAKGPDTTDGPAVGNWTITSSKSDGVTPGFTVVDGEGNKWFLKFDPRGYRGMTTGTEVAVTKLMWALGYNVPENHVAYMLPSQLTIGSTATFTPKSGRKRAMRRGDLDRLLAGVERERDGSIRVVASKALEGKPVGRIRFFGTRPDDPNDIVPHEDRRELRGYGVFAAWLNHVDAKAINSLDTLVTENGRSYVRHHLIDFGSTLGSGGVAPADYWAGSQYLLDSGTMGRGLVGFGLRRPSWSTAAFYEAPSIGRLPQSNHDFDPRQWKPRVPNRAFLHARADDQFWAARKLVSLRTDLLRAAVSTGDFGDPASEAFLVKTLAERRDAIARAYLTAVNPIADPVLTRDGLLTFENAAVDADVARAPESYIATWFTFENHPGKTTLVGETSSRSTTVGVPANLPNAAGTYVKVQLRSSGAPNAAWEKPVDAYFRMIGGEWKLIGFDRLPNA